MKKLTLDTDSLRVESFDVHARTGHHGTVRGYADTELDCESGFASRVYVCIFPSALCVSQVTDADCNTFNFTCECTQLPCLNETNPECP